MRRPFFLIFCCCIIVIVSIYYDIILIAIFLFLAMLIISVLLRRKTWSKLLAILILLMLVLSLYFQGYIKHKSEILVLQDQEVVLTGYVKSISDNKNSYGNMVLKTEKISHNNLHLNHNDEIFVNLSKVNEQLHELVGKQVTFKTRLTLPEQSRNPNCFDYNLYLKTKGIYLLGQAEMKDVHIIDDSYKRIIHHLFQVKHQFITKINSTMREDAAGVLIGLLFGDKGYLDSKIYSDFQKNGTAHILAVSGIHVGILYSLVQSIGNRNSKAKDLIVVVLLFTYVMLSNFSYSVIRAASMICIVILSKRVFRRYDLVTSASVSGTCFTLFNPFILFNVGFQLSFMAVFSIGILFPYIKNFYLKWKPFIPLGEKIMDGFLVLFSVQLGTMPLVAYHFNCFSISSFFINMPIILAAGIILPIGFVLFLTSIIGAELVFHYLVKMENVLIDSIIILNSFVAAHFKESFLVASPEKVFIFSYYLVLLFLTMEYKIEGLEKNKKKLLLSLLILSFLLTWILHQYKDNYDIIFLDVGQGDCIHIKTPRGKNILIDGGGKKGKDKHDDVGYKTLIPYFLKNNIRQIDYAIISHLHEDHYKGIVDILGDYKIRNLMLSGIHEKSGEASFIQWLCDESKTNILYLEKGNRIKVEKDIFITILYAKNSEMAYNRDEENDNSLVILLEYQEARILLTGDIEKKAENKIIEEDIAIRSDIIKVPHHGAETSSSIDFIKKVKPKVAVIQVGKNGYGHPSEKVIYLYVEQDAKVLRNDLDGAILVDITKNGMKIKTQLSGESYEL
ncbi:MAG: DNA internalization-related competence protein ComEC/Rec2 [Peptostreptococcales bacterium]